MLAGRDALGKRLKWFEEQALLRLLDDLPPDLGGTADTATITQGVLNRLSTP